MNPEGGCRTCDCDSFGTKASTSCDPVTGQCQCLTITDAGITGRRCDTCTPGYYRLSTRSL